MEGNKTNFMLLVEQMIKNSPTTGAANFEAVIRNEFQKVTVSLFICSGDYGVGVRINGELVGEYLSDGRLYDASTLTLMHRMKATSFVKRVNNPNSEYAKAWKGALSNIMARAVKRYSDNAREIINLKLD